MKVNLKSQFIDCSSFGQCNPGKIHGLGLLTLLTVSDSQRMSRRRGILLWLELLSWKAWSDGERQYAISKFFCSGTVIFFRCVSSQNAILSHNTRSISIHYSHCYNGRKIKATHWGFTWQDTTSHKSCLLRRREESELVRERGKK